MMLTLKTCRIKIGLELVGYVCSVEAPVQQKSFDLFKFGLSNGTKKVMCLIWGKELIDRHQPQVLLNRRLHVNKGLCKSSKFPKLLESQGFLPYEIIIQPNTTFNFFGVHTMLAGPPVVPPRQVNFDTIRDVEGKISIDGHIKAEFSPTASRYQNATYACGSITDGVHKIIVNISNYTVPVEVTRGMAVTVIGNIVNDPSIPLTISCADSTLITLREEEPLPELDLLRANRTLKRRTPPE
ncbi:uncharacterized protein LOC103315759 [Nasonia vitripennis]|uniref:Uncharacterized protein n=1 Tax=Nasonia vitripennis TaxID=7425 RepID=A0A7M7QFY6_NASVI|nr:uncharacterized protein LOC103315759 [Nasonia vitripennis]